MPLSKVQPATGGLDVMSSPDYVDAGKAPKVANVLTHLPGQTPMRGSLIAGSQPNPDTDWTGTPPLQIAGAWSNYKPVGGAGFETLVGYRTAAVPVAEVNGTLASNQLGGDKQYSYLANGHVIVNNDPRVTLSFNDAHPLGVGRRFTAAGDWIYGFSSNAPGWPWIDANNNTKVSGLLRWNGTSVPEEISYADGPRGGIDVAEWNGRLFVLGGMFPNARSRHDSVLQYSVPGGPAADSATALSTLLQSWKDPVTGLFNQLAVGFGNEQSVGLANVHGVLMVFKSDAIYGVYGTTQATWQVKPITTELGATCTDSILTYDQGVFFMSRRGLMYYDGSSFDHVSADVDNLFDPNRNVQLAVMRDGYILMLAYDRSDFATPANPPKLMMYHTGTRSWSTLTFASGLGMGDPQFIGTNAEGNPFIVTLTGFYVLDQITDPLRATALDTVGASSGTVASSVLSRTQALASPDKVAHIQRLLIDQFGLVRQSGDPTDMGWYVTLSNGRGETLFGPTQLLPAVTLTNAHYRLRNELDINAEANDVRVLIEWKPGTGLPSSLFTRKAAIFDSFVEFYTAQKRANS